jgi:hypothetical protein
VPAGSRGWLFASKTGRIPAFNPSFGPARKPSLFGESWHKNRTDARRISIYFEIRIQDIYRALSHALFIRRYKMAYDNLSPCAAEALRNIKQVKINGIMTGIAMLDESIAAVKEQQIGSDAGIRDALLAKVTRCNYVPRGAEEAYAAALLAEYHKASKTGKENHD